MPIEAFDEIHRINTVSEAFGGKCNANQLEVAIFSGKGYEIALIEAEDE